MTKSQSLCQVHINQIQKQRYSNKINRFEHIVKILKIHVLIYYNKKSEGIGNKYIHTKAYNSITDHYSTLNSADTPDLDCKYTMWHQ